MSGSEYRRPDSFVSEWWGDDFTPDLVSAIVEAPREQLIEFAEAALDLDAVQPEMAPGKLRPLTSAGGHAGDQLISTGQARGSARVRALALYAHQVAVWDPLPTELHLILSAARDNEDWSVERLRTALDSVMELKSLADAEIVLWIPSQAESLNLAWRGLGPDIDAESARIDVRGLPLVDEPELPVGVTIRNPHYSPWDDVHFAVMDVMADLSFSHDGRLVQALAGNPLVGRILPDLVESTSTQTDPRVAHLAKLVQLANSVTLPSAADVVAVHGSSSAFADWRLALERSLAIVGDLPFGASEIARARQVVFEELEGPRQRVQQELDSSTALSSLRRAGSSLGWSILGAAGGLLAGGRAAEAGAVAVTGATASWSREYVQDLRRRAGQRSLLTHYMFLDSADTGAHSNHSDPAWTTDRRVYQIPHNQHPLTKQPVPGRNEPCVCGSGRKYKNCCGR